MPERLKKRAYVFRILSVRSDGHKAPDTHVLKSEKIIELFHQGLRSQAEFTLLSRHIHLEKDIDVIDSATATDIVIRDTGPGISEEDLPHLFERFYKGRDSGPNSVGIGLAFTDQVVTALGGKVLQPENAPDGGAVFTVRLINKINV